MAKEQDQSMEDILQSIKRIIAEEGEAPGGSDVLELTEMVQEDGSVTKSPAKAEAPRIPTMSIDEIIAAPISGSAPEPAAAPAPAAAPTPPPQPKPEPAMSKPSEENLVSEKTLSASAAALEALKEVPAAAPAAITPISPGPAFRSGNTVEDLVMESLRPMLKQWLDANLTGIVERLVAAEIKKITAR